MISSVIIPLIYFFFFLKFSYWFPFYLKLSFDSNKDTNINLLTSITSPGGKDESNGLLRSPGCKGKE